MWMMALVKDQGGTAASLNWTTSTLTRHPVSLKYPNILHKENVPSAGFNLTFSYPLNIQRETLVE